MPLGGSTAGSVPAAWTMASCPGAGAGGGAIISGAGSGGGTGFTGSAPAGADAITARKRPDAQLAADVASLTVFIAFIR